LDGDVADVEILEVEVLGIGVRFGILEEAGHEANGLFGPST